jgi:hypothetical protein
MWPPITPASQLPNSTGHFVHAVSAGHFVHAVSTGHFVHAVASNECMLVFDTQWNVTATLCSIKLVCLCQQLEYA